MITERLDISDRGLAYGDGLFETIAYVDGRLHHWDLHWQRFSGGAQQLQIKLPDEPGLLSVIHDKLSEYQRQSLSQVSDDKAIIKIIVTRGSGGRGYVYPEQPESSLIVSVHQWPVRPDDDYLNGINATVCHTRLAQQPALAGLKHLNRLEQVLARNEFSASAYQEGIMLAYSDRDSQLDSLFIEGTSSNLFAVRNEQLLTAKIDSCGIRGTIREVVMQLAHSKGIDVQEGHFPLRQLEKAEEVFFTNSVFGILPVASITLEKKQQWDFSQRTISLQFAAVINKQLHRPYQFN